MYLINVSVFCYDWLIKWDEFLFIPFTLDAYSVLTKGIFTKHIVCFSYSADENSMIYCYVNSLRYIYYSRGFIYILLYIFVYLLNATISSYQFLGKVYEWKYHGCFHDLSIRPWGPFCLYSLDKIQLLRIMPSCISQLEFPFVSGQHTISKYRSLVVLIPFSCGIKSQLVHFHLTWKTASISQCNLHGSCVLSDGTYRYWTGKCYLSSRFHLKLISGI
jgi:hypothetical protein